jgi:spore germination cell wall hydrolase CwlJ-like protein
MAITLRQFERIGNIAAIVMAVLLATAIIAVAQESDAAVPPSAEAVAPVKLELKKSAPSPHTAPAAIALDSSVNDAMLKLVAEHKCLAQVMYFEARGEGEAGERAVAEVILHRLSEGSHGNTLCNVVYEGSTQTFCQFSFVCDGSLDKPLLPEPWRVAQVMAARILAGQGVPTNATDGATFFHSVSVRPSWAPRMERVARIGNHIFYRSKSAALNVAFRGSVR